MPWLLVKASVVTPIRRISPMLRDNPALTAFGALAVILSPILLWRAAKAVAQPIEPLLATPSSASPFMTSLVAVALLAGVVYSSSLPRLDSLDEQLRVVPLSRERLAMAHSLGPTALTSVVLAVPIGVILLPLASVAPGGAVSAPLVLATLILASVTGGVLVEAARVRQIRSLIEAWMLVGTIWLLAGVAGGDPKLGLIAIATRSIVRGPTLIQVLVLGTGVGVALILWARLVATESPRPRRTVVCASRRIRRPALVHFVVTDRVLRRRPAMRRHLVAVIALAIVATAFGSTAAGLSPDLASSLGAVVALLGVLVIPLAAFHLDVEARWLWGSVPSGPAARAAGRAGASLAGALASFVIVSLALALATRSDVSALLDTTLLLLLLLGPAVCSGALIPLDTTSVVSQVLTYGASAIASGGWYAATAAAVRHTESLALLPETAVVSTMSIAGIGFGFVIAYRQFNRAEER